MRDPMPSLTRIAAVLVCAVALAPPARADLKLPRVSPGAVVTQTLGITDITVGYSRPGVKGRVIWGDLVPYDKPWRTGANEATTFTTTGEIQFGGRALPAGTYSLLTLPGKDEWAVVLNSEKDMWGAFEYKPEKDVMRVTVRPAAAQAQEWMEFSFENLTPTTADLVLRWEKLRLAVPLSVDVNGQTLAAARAALADLKADDWRTPYQAAGFCFNNDTALDEGRKWLDRSIGILPTHANLNLLARWQMKTGNKQDAIATARKAIEVGKASKEKVDTTPTEKLLAEWTAK